MNRNNIVNSIAAMQAWYGVTFTFVVETVDTKQVYIKRYCINYNCNIFPVYLSTILDRLHSHLILCRNTCRPKCKTLNISVTCLQCLFKRYTIQNHGEHFPSHSGTPSKSINMLYDSHHRFMYIQK